MTIPQHFDRDHALAAVQAAGRIREPQHDGVRPIALLHLLGAHLGFSVQFRALELHSNRRGAAHSRVQRDPLASSQSFLAAFVPELGAIVTPGLRRVDVMNDPALPTADVGGLPWVHSTDRQSWVATTSAHPHGEPLDIDFTVASDEVTWMNAFLLRKRELAAVSFAIASEIASGNHMHIDLEIAA